MLQIALTHDVDRIKKTYQFFTKPALALLKVNLKLFSSSLSTTFKKDNYWRLNEIINIEEKYNVRSSFYFLNESIKFNLFKPQTFVLAKGRYDINDPRIINIIRFLDKNGWEIGVHGSFNSFQDFELLLHEKKVLEQILGHEVIGIRQHHLNMNSNTWNYQFNAGLKYDTSFGSNENIGFKNNKYNPFHPLDNEFTVFPLVIMDFCFMQEEDRWSKLDEIFDRCENEKGILVINWHNAVFNNFDFPKYGESYIKIIELAKARGAVFKTLKEFYLEKKTKIYGD